MEQKKSTVTHVKTKSDSMTADPIKDPQTGKYSHTITFANGDQGWNRSDDVNASGFPIGKEVEYVRELQTKKDKSGTYYSIYTPAEFAAKPQWKGGAGGGGKGYAPKTGHQIKMESRSMLMRYAVDLWLGDKINLDKLKETYTELCSIYDYAMDELGTGATTSQS